MPRVLIRTQPWGVVWDDHGNALSGVTAQIKNTDATAATTWSAETGGSSTTADQITDSGGGIPRYIEEDEYDLTVNGTTRRVQAVAAHPGKPFNVKLYGAKGDGTTDDTTAIRAAITAAGSTGIVFFPPGTYHLTGSLTVASGLTLQGAGLGSVIDISANASGLIGTSLSNITIQGLKFLGNGGTSDTGSGIELTSCTRVQVRGCHFESMATSASGGAGTVFNGCSQVVFANNTGLDAGYALVNFFNCNGFTAVGNVHSNTRAAGVLSTCCYANSGSVDGTFTGNTSVNDTWPFEVRVAAKRIAVVGNTIKGCKNQAIVVQSTAANLVTDVVVANNVIELATGATDGIFVDSCTNVSVTGNVIVGPATSAQIIVTRAGAASDGTDTLIANNMVRSAGAGGMGIRVNASCLRTTVIGNHVQSTTDQRSIYCEANDCTIRNNYVYDSGWHGIESQGSDCQVLNNRIKTTRNSGNGIIFSGAGGELAGNLVTGSAGAALNVSGSAVKQHGNKISGGASQGRAVLVGGTVTVSTTEVLAAENILLTRVVTGGTVGHLTVGTIVAGTSFVINSSSGTDTSTVFWEIVH